MREEFESELKDAEQAPRHFIAKMRPVGWLIGYFNYTCSHCELNEVSFIVRLSLVRNEKELSWCLEKVGQYPPWSIDPPDELKAALGDYEPIYKKGTICESQGYGVGAFAYYRRIVEKIIDSLLADIAGILPACTF